MEQQQQKDAFEPWSQVALPKKPHLRHALCVPSNPEAGAQLCSLLISALSTTDLLSHYESDLPHGEALYSIV